MPPPPERLFRMPPAKHKLPEITPFFPEKI